MNELEKEKVVKFFTQILNQYDFEIIIDTDEISESIFRLRDYQKGNLGGIEQEKFYTLSDIINRLELYHQDYIYEPLESRQNNNEIIAKDDWELIAKRYLEDDNVAIILSNIHTPEYLYLINKNNQFNIADIIKILDEDEKFYETICKKYIHTMSKEMLLEKDNKILHIFIEDEYIELKEKGLINNQNYKKYLDLNFNVYEYDSYQDLYNSVIKDEIAYDLNDLGLFDDNGKWNFYITFEELKKIGYGFMVKEQFPLLQKYILEDKEVFDFFNHFSLEELNNFEKTLYLYFETDDIDFDKERIELYSKSNYNFNSNILYLAEGMLTYDDFMDDYIEHIPTNYELSLQKVCEYFSKNNIKDLMEYGSDYDEGVYHISNMYKEILDELNIKYKDIFTEDGLGDGKYITSITFEDNSEIKLDINAWDGIRTVTENIEGICNEYQKKSLELDKEIEI